MKRLGIPDKWIEHRSRKELYAMWLRCCGPVRGGEGDAATEGGEEGWCFSLNSLRFRMRVPRSYLFRGMIMLGVASGHTPDASSQDEVKPVDIVVSADRMNILYCDIENPITIAVPGVRCEDLVVSVSSGTLSGAGCGYLIEPRCGPVVLLIKAEWKDGAVQRSATSEFRVKYVPVPVAFFGGRAADDETIRLIEAQAARGVAARLQGFEFDILFRVVHFRFRIQRGAATVFDSEAGEAKLSQTMIDASGSLAVGDVIRVSDIRGMGPSGKIHELKALRLEVIE